MKWLWKLEQKEEFKLLLKKFKKSVDKQHNRCYNKDKIKERKKEVNTMKKATAIRNYRRFTGAEEYIVGFIYGHNLYAIQVEELMPRWMVMKAESSRHAEKLQMNLKAKHKRELINKGAELICTEEEFLQMNDLRNKGFTFERLVFDLNGQGAEWSRDNVRFDKCGDININGVEIQIKFENAQIVTVPTIKKLQKEYR